MVDAIQAGNLFRLLRSAGILSTELVFVARDELALDGRELVLEKSHGASVPPHPQGNIFGIGRDEEAIYCISAPAPTKGSYASLMGSLYWVRKVSPSDWTLCNKRQTPEQVSVLDDLFEQAAEEPGRWLQLMNENEL